MEKTLANQDIVMAINTVNSETSFRNNPDIKLPYDIMWVLRVNMKQLEERHKLLIEEINDFSSIYMTDDKVEIIQEQDGEEQKILKSEFRDEFTQYINAHINNLMLQSNKMSLETYAEKTLADFMKLVDGKLSMPEWDLLEFFVGVEEAEQ